MIRIQKAFAFACLFAICLTMAEDVSKIMEENGIVPDVLDTVPSKLVQVKYPSGAVAELGNELTPTQVKDIPTVTWDADKDSYYTLILTDPDAPSRQKPTFREFRHWLVVNIPGDNVSAGATLFDYIGSGPPKDTGLHRYIFLVYKQDGILSIDSKTVPNNSRAGRPSSSTREFVSKYGLGDPVAGNFYQAQYDDYVPILHAQFAKL